MNDASAADLFWLGVDAGGTGTRAVLATQDGRVSGRGEAGPGNPQVLGEERAAAAWSSAIRHALDGHSPTLVQGLALGVAGVRSPEEAARARRLLLDWSDIKMVQVTGDLEIAHAAALGGAAGTVVIAGTGSAALASDGQGRNARAGGWGWLADDAGGGYWLARRALAAACAGADGRGPATTLGERAAAFYQTSDLRGALAELQGPGHDRARVAAFAREVLAAATAGDLAAKQCRAEAVEALLSLAKAAREGLGRTTGSTEAADHPLVLVGGLPLEPWLAERARAEGFAPRAAWGPPVLGAVLLAAQAGGGRLDAQAKTRLLTTWTTPA